ncbi:RluA family pseudouridine synthase [Halobacteriovorax sp. DPLXC-1]|uniref:RluA family pseudouridine synthase n=1 Tax=Halobacteriovorax sp. DPLXC-1 TaxID=3110771 RepID=UPI002FF36B99
MKKKIQVLFEDEHYIAATKPSDLLVHPFKARSQDRRSLLRSLKKQTDLYLFPIHRLDKPVSGVVLFAKSKEATRLMKEQWNSENVSKHYIAMVKGVTETEGVYDFPIKTDKGLQEAKTSFKTLTSNDEYSLVDIEIFTGRQHQIRKHFSRRMHNLVGDTKYGHSSINNIFRKDYKFYRIFLHSYQLRFIHPFTKEEVIISSPVTEDCINIANDLFQFDLTNIGNEAKEN